jgi:hypothetical protein
VNTFQSVRPTAPLDLVRRPPLMERTSGRPEVVVGLLDGAVALDHPDLATEHIREVPGGLPGSCSQISNAACLHATFVAEMLAGRRGSASASPSPRSSPSSSPACSHSTSGS